MRPPERQTSAPESCGVCLVSPGHPRGEPQTQTWPVREITTHNPTFLFSPHAGQFGADPLQHITINFLLLETELGDSKAHGLVVHPHNKGFNDDLLKG